MSTQLDYDTSDVEDRHVKIIETCTRAHYNDARTTLKRC